ncbi:hypothetical protein LGV61_11930 [Desulfurispirillum indicum]|uniref:hypothetical protein n=1 Tax=Desulfurispirillum indicum TaxID=936456 RepID=UPI001CFA60E4|nr:hypothetical protein [Desulfurispirillum indicum]UCZ56423.1 hypothetical protein LGV61_11930 [Desulfurispirillum indicum]
MLNDIQSIANAFLRKALARPNEAASMALPDLTKLQSVEQKSPQDIAEFSSFARRQVERNTFAAEHNVIFDPMGSTPKDIDADTLLKAKERMESLQQEELSRLSHNLGLEDESMLNELSTADLVEYLQNSTRFRDPSGIRVSFIPGHKPPDFDSLQEFIQYKFQTDDEGNFLRDNQGKHLRREGSEAVVNQVLHIVGQGTTYGARSTKPLSDVNPAVLHFLNNAFENDDASDLAQGIYMAYESNPYTFFDPTAYDTLQDAMSARIEQFGYFPGQASKWQMFMDEGFILQNLDVLYDDMKFLELLLRE